MVKTIGGKRKKENIALHYKSKLGYDTFEIHNFYLIILRKTRFETYDRQFIALVDK